MLHRLNLRTCLCMFLCIVSPNSISGPLDKPTHGEILTACKVLLDRTSAATDANDPSLVIVLNQAYASICKDVDVPNEYSTYFSDLRAQYRATPRCFALNGEVANSVGGFTNLEIEEYLKFRRQGFDIEDLQSFEKNRSFNPADFDANSLIRLESSARKLSAPGR